MEKPEWLMTRTIDEGKSSSGIPVYRKRFSFKKQSHPYIEKVIEKYPDKEVTKSVTLHDRRNKNKFSKDLRDKGIVTDEEIINFLREYKKGVAPKKIKTLGEKFYGESAAKKWNRDINTMIEVMLEDPVVGGDIDRHKRRMRKERGPLAKAKDEAKKAAKMARKAFKINGDDDMGYRKYGPQKGTEKLDFNEIQRKAVMHGYAFVGKDLANKNDWKQVEPANVFDEETLNIIKEDGAMTFVKLPTSSKHSLSGKGLVGDFSRERIQRGKMVYRATNVANKGMDTLEVRVEIDNRYKGDITSWRVRSLIIKDGKVKNEDTATVFPMNNAPKPIPSSLAESFAINEMKRLTKKFVRGNKQQIEEKKDWEEMKTERQTTIGRSEAEQVKFKQEKKKQTKQEKEPIKQDFSEFKKEGYSKEETTDNRVITRKQSKLLSEEEDVDEEQHKL